MQLWRSIDAFHTYRHSPSSAAEAIEEPLTRLRNKTRALRLDESPFVQSTSLALELILHMSRPSQSETNLTALAEELKEALCMIQLRACSYMDLTSFPLMLGAIAANPGSETRAWFYTRLKGAVLALQQRGWDNPLELFDSVLASDVGLIGRLKALRNELQMETSSGKIP